MTPLAPRTALLLALLAPAWTRSVQADDEARRGKPRRPIVLDESLAAGGFRRAGDGLTSASARATPVEPPAVLLRRLQALEAGAGPVVVPGPGPSPRARGERLVVSLDDDMQGPPSTAYEGRLDVSGGAAGPQDVVAVRFPSRALAKSPPFRLTEALLGFDDFHGATTWPRIGVALEDPSRPLYPGAGVQVTNFDPGLAPAPVEALGPTSFVRARVGMPNLDVPDSWISDGAFDDDFSGPAGPLDDLLTSDWREYENGAPSNVGLDVSGGRVVRATPAAATLAIKIPDGNVEAVRPALDLDVDVSVDLDVGAAGSQVLGVVVRAMATDALYRIEFDEAAGAIRVQAVTTGGPVQLGPALSPVVLTGTRVVLGVTVTGTNPVTLVVSAGATTFPAITDSTWRFTGTYAGLSASSGATTGEAWDDFGVSRRPDAFVVVEYPPGEDAGLPLDLSQDSLVTASLDPAIPPAGNVLVSADGGASFAPRPSGAGCHNPGNPFVQLEVEDVTDLGLLFDYEAHVVEVSLACPTCPTTRNECVENVSEAERWTPVITEGEPYSISVAWWNEHRLVPTLSFHVTVWDAPCSVSGNAVLDQLIDVADGLGQLDVAAELHSSFLTGDVAYPPGLYCVVVEEVHEAPTFDSNPTTRFVVRDFEIAESCVPLATPNIDGGSLRVTRPAGDAVTTTLSWEVLAGFPGRFNVHRMEAARLPDGTCFHEAAPIVDRVVGATQRTYDLPALPGARAHWMAVFEQDGCPSANSIPDSSLNDPALPCWP